MCFDFLLVFTYSSQSRHLLNIIPLRFEQYFTLAPHIPVLISHGLLANDKYFFLLSRIFALLSRVSHHWKLLLLGQGAINFNNVCVNFMKLCISVVNFSLVMSS
uniref:Uncharacterized protein n=1 Tax=Cacopsylla melanoneura TaxID=428564 RepID=A0A8D9EK12_9HEMI